MLSLLLIWIVSAVALLVTSKLVKGFEIKDFKAAMIASLIIGFLNAVLRPILIILTLPINILTLGLFTFVVNAVVLKMAAGMMSSFRIDRWKTAIIAAVVLVIVNLLFSFVFSF